MDKSYSLWLGTLDHIWIFIHQHLLTASLSISIAIKLVFFLSSYFYIKHVLL
jgi:hypothetical protein